MIRHNKILLVEDNEDDIVLAKKAFKKLNLPDVLEVAINGKAALSQIKEKNEKGENFCLVIIDLQIPLINGKELLVECNKLENFYSPIIVLSTSSEIKDVRDCYRLNAASFIQKPVDYEEFIYTIECVINYWLKLNIVK